MNCPQFVHHFACDTLTEPQAWLGNVQKAAEVVRCMREPARFRENFVARSRWGGLLNMPSTSSQYLHCSPNTPNQSVLSALAGTLVHRMIEHARSGHWLWESLQKGAMWGILIPPAHTPAKHNARPHNPTARCRGFRAVTAAFSGCADKPSEAWNKDAEDSS